MPQLTMPKLSFSLAFLIAVFAMPKSVPAQVYELRTYTTNEGKLDALNARFRDHTVDLFKKHGIESMGYFVPTDKARSKDTLVYVIKHKSRDAAKESWKAFLSDPDWKKVAKESQLDGPILAKSPESVYMKLTDYTPQWKSESSDDDDVFELRIYQAAPDKLEKLDARFRDHTIKLFERHGIQSVAYWHATDKPESADHLYYIIKHDNADAAKKSWKAFGQDPDWRSAAKASGVGRLAKPPTSIYMKPTDYSTTR